MNDDQGRPQARLRDADRPAGPRRSRACKLDENDFGDVVAGRPLVDDALAGYLRDDLWAQNGTMYFVSAAPVIKRDPPVEYVGAVVLGHKVTNELATEARRRRSTSTSASISATTTSPAAKPLALDHTPMLDGAQDAHRRRSQRATARRTSRSIGHAGTDAYTAIVARLPGEARDASGAYYAVFVKRPRDARLRRHARSGHARATCRSATSRGSLVGGVFLLVLARRHRLHVDRVRSAAAPARRRRGQAREERDRAARRGRARRQVRLDRAQREHPHRQARPRREDARARTSISCSGPRPRAASARSICSPARCRRRGPGGPAPAASPPPSDFQFARSGAGARPRHRRRRDAAPHAAAAPRRRADDAAAVDRRRRRRAASRRSAQLAANMPPPLSLDDDILGGAPAATGAGGVDPYFKQVYDQFVVGQEELRRADRGPDLPEVHREARQEPRRPDVEDRLQEVRFTVYVKDGKAALKATPVKDE